MARDKQEPKQRTPKGLEIPVPKRKDVMDALRKLVQPVKKPLRVQLPAGRGGQTGSVSRFRQNATGQPGEGLAPDGVSVRTRVVGRAWGGTVGTPASRGAGGGAGWMPEGVPEGVPGTGTFGQTP
jgi:hypothetical protein